MSKSFAEIARHPARMAVIGGCLIAVALLALIVGFMSVSATLGPYDGSDGVKDTNNTAHPVSCGPDLPSGQGDNAFGQGSKDDDQNPTIVSGSIPPNKSDLDEFCTGFIQPSLGDAYLYLYWHRTNVLGTANFSFEYNQKSCPPDCSSNGVTPLRTAGDLLITYDFAAGGGKLIIGVSKWVAGGAATQCQKNNSTPCWGTSAFPTTGQVEAAINADSLRGEAVIDLTSSGIIPAGQCLTFRSVYVKGRSSAAFDSELKDFIAPIPASVNTCPNDTTTATEIHLGSGVGETTPTVVSAPVALGSTVHDMATVTPTGSFTPTGTVTFTFFRGGDCTTGTADTATAADTVSLASAVAHPSPDKGPLAAGSYAFQAHYNSDAHNNASTSACEPLTVNKGTLGITTQIHDAQHNNVGGATHVPLGSVVHDTASLSGATAGFTPTGVLTFRFFTTINCSGASTSPVTSPEATFYGRSADSASLAAGVYSYDASIATDSNYNAAGPATCEPLTVDKGTLGITTQIHDASHANVGGAVHVPVGSVVHDTASLSGATAGFTPSGTLTFRFFTTINCSGASTSPVTSPEATFYGRSADSASLAAGVYSYDASIATDSNYNAAGPATCEPLTVDKLTPTLGTAPKLLPNDDATITGNGAIALSGTLTFKLFLTADCSEITPVLTQQVSVSGVGPFTKSTSNTTHLVTADATVRWTVDYTGDSSYNDASSGCQAEGANIDFSPFGP